ncbi:DUF3796 domain-containing protein [Bacteroidota bacterium]
MKGINPLGLLGLLGLLALLGPLTGEWPFVATMGYFVFFKYLKVIPDELFKDMMKASASTGFFVTQVSIIITMVAWAIFSRLLEMNIGGRILFWGNLASIYAGFIVFAFKLSFLENKEKKDIKNAT